MIVARLARLLIQRCGEILTPFLQKRLIGILAGGEAEDDGSGAEAAGKQRRRKADATARKRSGKDAEEDGKDDEEEEEDGGQGAADTGAVASVGDGGGGLLRGGDALSAVVKVGHMHQTDHTYICGYQGDSHIRPTNEINAQMIYISMWLFDGMVVFVGRV